MGEEEEVEEACNDCADCDLQSPPPPPPPVIPKRTEERRTREGARVNGPVWSPHVSWQPEKLRPPNLILIWRVDVKKQNKNNK